MKAHKLPSGNWRCLVYLGKDSAGHPMRESVTARTKKQAEIAAAMRLNEYQGNKSRLTVKNAVAAYIRTKESVLSPSTVRSYLSLHKNHFVIIGNVPIDKLTSEQIQQEINHASINCSPKTVKNLHGLLTATLRLYRPGFVPVVHLPEQKRKEPTIPTDDIIKTLLKAVKGHYLELPIMLAAFGPMRRGEICALRSQNITQNTVHVCENMVHDKDNVWRIKGPKTAAGDRFIEYPDFVAKLWQGKKGRLFDVTPNQLTKDFKAFLQRNNLPVFRFHDLRHYSASIQHALGVPDAYIISRGGWTTDATLKAVYRHALSDKSKEMSALVNNHFSALSVHETAHESKNAP